MPRDTTSDQPFFHHCAYCGVPLSGRFSPCPACHALPIDSFDTDDKPGERSARSRALSASRTQLEPLPAAASLPADRSSRRSAQTKMSPYDLIDEATFEPGGRRRRHPLALAAAALATLGVVYVGFVLLNDDDASVDTPVTVFGTVRPDNPGQAPAQNVAQNAAPPVAAAPKPASIVAPSSTQVVATVPAVAPSSTPIVATAPNVARPTPPVVTTAPTTARSSPPIVATTPTVARSSPQVVATAPAVARSAPPVVATAPVPARPSTPVVATAPTVARPTPPVVTTAPTVASTKTLGASISAPTPSGTAVASTSTNTNTDTMAALLTQADKQRADAERNLKAAHGYLQRGNLSATKARLAAVITAQPGNRDARSMRAQLSTLEQQRDALLSLARGCGNVGHWECASHNANEALRIDSSSKAAQRLVALASHESAWQTMQPTAEESRALRDLLRHH
ncbi:MULTISPECIES: hypothetical protein [unclassified Paraburkholderia]|uniref:hypothetical protein n=1 Tax=unclassified Paraburkholderia TaxID=2615204 RepID=UPI0016127F3E|nr:MULTISPECIES: hypothetical protein [unclassified Paraburkholderia]MBB5445135.1 hypothetical protein [Paraburkholderia sp. WSM4177]MBB5485683.1 hypothetical protein [Paraburkholderia sp. WSM4180]